MGAEKHLRERSTIDWIKKGTVDWFLESKFEKFNNTLDLK